MDLGDGLGKVAAAITDEIAVDWTAARRDHPDLAPELDGLRLLERIGTVFRAPAAVPAGESWGPLRIGDRLGAGAYGTVYRAFDPQLQREVALKLLRDDLPGGGLHARRILAEARLMARVRHPNVLVIHGADEHDGRVGFWTDLLDGVTLEQRLADGTILGAGEAAACGRELCRALAAVHAAGLVHGDVKAANVMRDSRGRIVLMDFGAGTENAAAPAGAGFFSGTPLVLAPEILAGGAHSAAGDLYSLGVLLYRLVTGRYPVEADTIADLKQAHAAGRRTPLLDRRPDLPAGFVQAVETALAADPARRWTSAGQMERALATDPAGAGATRRGRRRVLGIIAAAAAVIAV
ncbi:MAG: serine/threonine protein kinase, partial [Krumholzibacteria bacterium]|nr:serine/threonine protein kinase [Candidatus Krumholzibacteria bacterium]